MHWVSQKKILDAGCFSREILMVTALSVRIMDMFFDVAPVPRYGLYP